MWKIILYYLHNTWKKRWKSEGIPVKRLSLIQIHIKLLESEGLIEGCLGNQKKKRHLNSFLMWITDKKDVPQTL